MSAYRTLRLLYKYLFYTGAAKDYNRSVPLIIKVDPIIVYLRHYITFNSIYVVTLVEVCLYI